MHKNDEPTYEDLMKPEPAKEFVMPFGKYRGETLEQIYLDDRSYLDWLLSARKYDDSDEIVQKIRGTEKEMRRVRVYE